MNKKLILTIIVFLLVIFSILYIEPNFILESDSNQLDILVFSIITIMIGTVLFFITSIN